MWGNLVCIIYNNTLQGTAERPTFFRRLLTPPLSLPLGIQYIQFLLIEG